VSDNKNQHFVPKVLFKPFTKNCEGKSVCLLNLQTRSATELASVRGQCSKNFFYGNNPKLENAIRYMEGCYGILREKIVRHDLHFGERDLHAILKRFILFQSLRTNAALRRSKMAITESPFGEALGKDSIPENIDIISLMMQGFIDVMGILDDLRIVLIENFTRRDFIMSDNPSIITNRWHLQRQGMSNFGLGSAGAMAFLPISPRIVAMLYDDGVYSVARSGLWIKTSKERDVLAVNEHQFLQCDKTVYFSSWDEVELIRQDLDHALQNRPRESERSELVTAALESEDEWGKRYVVVPDSARQVGGECLVHMKSVNPCPHRWPSFMQFRRDAKFIDTGTGAGFLRRKSAS